MHRCNRIAAFDLAQRVAGHPRQIRQGPLRHAAITAKRSNQIRLEGAVLAGDRDILFHQPSPATSSNRRKSVSEARPRRRARAARLRGKRSDSVNPASASVSGAARAMPASLSAACSVLRCAQGAPWANDRPKQRVRVAADDDNLGINQIDHARKLAPDLLFAQMQKRQRLRLSGHDCRLRILIAVRAHLFPYAHHCGFSVICSPIAW